MSTACWRGGGRGREEWHQHGRIGKQGSGNPRRVGGSRRVGACRGRDFGAIRCRGDDKLVDFSTVESVGFRDPFVDGGGGRSYGGCDDNAVEVQFVNNS